MSYNGSGTFTINSTGQPVVAGTVITASAFNALTTDLATGLTTAITKDGQTTTTARITFAQGITSSLVTDSSSVSTGSIITAGGVGIAKALYVGTTANVAGAVTLGGIATFSAQPIFSSLTASSAVATDASKGLVSVTNTGTGNNVLATSPTITTPTISSLSSASATALTLQSAGTTAITVDTSQNVGIGTTATTTYRATIANNGGNQLRLYATDVASSTTNTIDFWYLDSGGSPYNNTSIRSLSTANAGNGNLVFYTTPTSGSLTERMRIDSSGNVGIGTSSPAQKLQVLAVNTTGFAGAAIQNQNTNVGIAGVQFSSDTTYFKSAIGQVRSDANGVGSLVFYNASSTGAANWSTSDERMRIDSSGNLLVGTTSSGGKISSYQTANDVALYARCTNASQTQIVFNVEADRNTTNNTFYAISYTNNGAGAYKFRVADSGNVTNTNNSYGAISDIKLKENITDATPKLDKLNQVRIVNYNFIGDEQKQLGVIAQELEQIFPSMVEESPDKDKQGNDLGTKTKAVKYSVFVPILIKAMQEQQATINALTARIVALESK